MNEDLLLRTINSLEDICTSILQTKRNISQDILIGKLSFVGTTAGVSSLVSAINIGKVKIQKYINLTIEKNLI